MGSLIKSGPVPGAEGLDVLQSKKLWSLAPEEYSGLPKVFPDLAGRPGEYRPESGFFGAESERKGSAHAA